MKSWIFILLLLLVACAAAFGWQMLAADPGYVQVQFGDTRIETTLLFAIVALLLFWALASLLWRALRWPVKAWTHRSQRRGRERIASGLVAVAEGRHQHALRELERASHHTGLRAPALLAAARAAHARGEHARADTALDEAKVDAAPAALALRARFLIERGDPAAALALLKAEKSDLAPAAQKLLIESALACGDHASARDALGALAKSQSLPADAFAALETRVLVGALANAPDAERLHALWSGLSRTQRRTPEAVAAYAKRAAVLGEMLPAMDEIESALRKEWSERLVRVWSELGEAEMPARLRRAESWLTAQPNSPGLMLTLGRLCNQSALWGKAREYLLRGLAIEESAPLWEALGDCCNGQKVGAEAATCYCNALKLARGETTQPLADTTRSALDTRASVVEERSEHGVPRLRGN